MSAVLSESLPLTGSLKNVDRPEVLPGATFKLKNVPTGHGKTVNVYITINELNGSTFEVFVNAKDANLSELLSLSTLTITEMLRNDIPLDRIVDRVMSVSSNNTGHMVPGGYCPSLAARIGMVLKQWYDAGGLKGVIETAVKESIK